MPRPPLHDLLPGGRTALVLQEVQRGVLGQGVPGREAGGIPDLRQAAESVGLIPNLARLTSAARRTGVPVLHCTIGRLDGSFGYNRNARLFTMFDAGRRAGSGSAPAAAPGAREAGAAEPLHEVYAPGDVVIPRYQGLGPMAGELDRVLRNVGITGVVATGVSLNVGMIELVFGLVDLGYDVVLPRDAVVGLPVEYGEQVIRNTLGLLATVTTTADLIAEWEGAP